MKTDADDESRIVHFDATIRRRERLRNRATGQSPAPGPSKKSHSDNGVKKHLSSENGAPVDRSVEPLREKHVSPQQHQPVSEGHSSETSVTSRPSTPPSASAPTSADASEISLPSRKEIETFLVDFVVEQTGYPVEMVELDADLEADLGIDSIKKAQLFGEMAEQLGIEATQIDLSEGPSLDDFPTLASVIDFLEQSVAGGATSASQATAKPATAAPPASTTSPNSSLPSSSSLAPQPNAPSSVAGASAASSPSSATASVPGETQAAAKETGGPKTPSAPQTLPSRDELEKFLVNFVVEQTGYPEEMVEMDADLEADLGIDSIKKAQLFGEMAENIGIPVATVEIDPEMSLDDFPTLRHVLDFLWNAAHGERTSSATPAASPATPATLSAPPVEPKTSSSAEAVAKVQSVEERLGSPSSPAPSPAPSADPASGSPPVMKTKSGEILSDAEFERFLVDFVVEQTGYPPEMVELDADLEADLGIDSIKKAQLFGEMAEQLDVQIEISEDMSLDDFPTLRHVLEFMRGGRPAGAH